MSNDDKIGEFPTWWREEAEHFNDSAEEVTEKRERGKQADLQWDDVRDPVRRGWGRSQL